jgi:hypothetical protein
MQLLQSKVNTKTKAIGSNRHRCRKMKQAQWVNLAQRINENTHEAQPVGKKCLPDSDKPPTIECYPEGCAAPGEVLCQCNTRGSLSKLKRTPPQTKINVTSKFPVGNISVVTLIRTDTTLDHSQKAEKVWSLHGRGCDGQSFNLLLGEVTGGDESFLTLHVSHFLSSMYCWGPEPPQKLWKSHWCVPFTATFSKRRKIGALWSERCDA